MINDTCFAPLLCIPKIPFGKKWVEEDGVVYLPVFSNGKDSRQWLWLYRRKLTPYVKDILQSPMFVPTDGVTYTLAILRGTFFPDDDMMTMMNIRSEGASRGWSDPPIETACLVRNLLCNDELRQLGLRNVNVMHLPVLNQYGEFSILNISKDNWLNTRGAGPSVLCDGYTAFAFLVESRNRFDILTKR